MDTDFGELVYFPIELQTEVWPRCKGRHRQVAELAWQGFNVKESAAILKLSPGTIRRHRADAVDIIRGYAPSGGGHGSAQAMLGRLYSAQLVNGSTEGLDVPPRDWQPQHHTRRGLSGRRP